MKRFGATVPGALLPDRIVPRPQSVEEQEKHVRRLERERDATVVKITARETYNLSEARLTAHDVVIDEIAGTGTYEALHVGVWLSYGKRIGQQMANSRSIQPGHDGVAVPVKVYNATLTAVLMLVSADLRTDPWGLARRMREGPGEEHRRNPKAPWCGTAYEEWQATMSELADVLDTLLEGEPRPSVAAVPPLIRQDDTATTPWPKVPMTGDPKRDLLAWGAEISRRSVGMTWDERVGVIAEGVAMQEKVIEATTRELGQPQPTAEAWNAWGSLMTSMALIASHWAQSGFPTLRPTHKLAASLMATHIPKDLVPEVRLPWPSFMVEVPEGILPDTERPWAEGVALRVKVIGLVTGVGEHGEPDVGLFIGSTYVTTDPMLRLLVHVVDVPIPDLTQLADLEIGYETIYGASAVKLLGRLLLNMMIEVDSPSYRSEIGRGPSRPSSPKKGNGREKGALPSAWVIEVRRDVKLDARKWVTDYVQSKGTSPSVQTLVRGHRKRQPYGPRGMNLRRWIHIEPYWRGPEDAPVVARTMVMDEKTQGIGS